MLVSMWPTSHISLHALLTMQVVSELCLSPSQLQVIGQPSVGISLSLGRNHHGAIVDNREVAYPGS